MSPAFAGLIDRIFKSGRGSEQDLRAICRENGVEDEQLDLVLSIARASKEERECVKVMPEACNCYPVFCAMFWEMVKERSIQLWGKMELDESSLLKDLRPFVKEDILKWLMRLLVASVILSYDSRGMEFRIDSVRGDLGGARNEVAGWDSVLAPRLRESRAMNHYRGLTALLKEVIGRELRDGIGDVRMLKQTVDSFYVSSRLRGEEDVNKLYRKFWAILSFRIRLSEKERMAAALREFVEELGRVLRENFSQEGLNELRLMSEGEREERLRSLMERLEESWSRVDPRPPRWEDVGEGLMRFLREGFGAVAHQVI